MRSVHRFLTVLAFSCLTSASALVPREPQIKDVEAWRRATPEAPNGYAPGPVDCPSTRPSIRVASGLSDAEKEWLKRRRANTIAPMRELLTRLNITGFDVNKYFNDNRDNTSALPNVAIAFSGGGYRAMTNGAGGLAAFDSRTPNSTNEGQIGGLLQASTYIAGLSGGGWLVGSIYANNFTSVQNIIDQKRGSTVWQLENTILEGPPQSGGLSILSTPTYYKNLIDTVSSKKSAGFDISLTDYWGRALSFQMVNATDGGPAYTFSSIQDDVAFKNASAPMPFLVADERAPGEVAVSLKTTNIEFNPFEMGSFDPTLYGFAPLRYLGSNFTEGRLPDDQKCIAGFDNAGFTMGTSSSLFNVIITQLTTINSVPGFVKQGLAGVVGGIGQDSNDIADFTPNPFFHFHNRTNPSAQSRRLTLVDGGEDLQNIPLNPLIQPVRNVDVIFAVDSSADTVPPTNSAQNWPNGTALVATYQRSYNDTMQNGTAFPSIPDQNTFVNFGFNYRPTFFGCDARNASTDTNTAPLIVYLPNAPYVYNSNKSTTQMEYNITERNAMIQNGYNVVTQGNGTRDSQWPTCVGCAIMSRSWTRTGAKVPDVCARCFTRYCWNGTVATQTPRPYFPQMILSEIKVTGGVGRFVPNILGFALAAVVSGYLVL